MLSLEQALLTVKAKMGVGQPAVAVESLPLLDARGRVLARDVNADRDYPPFDRSTRDGYAVRSADLNALPVNLHCLGEARAGTPYGGTVANQPRGCVEIMTGAPLPAGTDAVVMLEHVRANGRNIEVLRQVAPYENVVRQGTEAPAGSTVLPRGRRLQAGDMGLLASVGQALVEVFRRPTVAILPTGDEIVPVESPPQWFQIRNSNAITLAAVVSAAGGIPRVLEIAPDDRGSLRQLVEQAFESDLVILSGGVS